METPYLRLLELAGIKAPTIASATQSDGNINRKTADRILDPHHYFHAKWPSKVTEADDDWRAGKNEPTIRFIEAATPLLDTGPQWLQHFVYALKIGEFELTADLDVQDYIRLTRDYLNACHVRILHSDNN